MSNSEIYIHVINEIQLNDVVANNSKKSVPTDSVANKKKNNESISKESSDKNKKIGMSVYQNARKLLIATGTEQLQNVGQVVGTSVRYGVLAAKALSGDIVSAMNLVSDIACQALTKAIENAKKIAAINNESDNAAVHAGVLDVEDVKITTNFITGRYTYNIE